jgi:hypothetical protein
MGRIGTLRDPRPDASPRIGLLMDSFFICCGCYLGVKLSSASAKKDMALRYNLAADGTGEILASLTKLLIFIL